MHICYDCIATKTCPSYEFLVVFGQARVWDRKSAGRGGRRLEWSAGWVQVRSVQVQAKFLQFLRVRGRAGLNFAGAGRVQTQNFNPHRTLIDMFQVKEFTQSVSNKCQKLRYSYAVQPLREITWSGVHYFALLAVKCALVCWERLGCIRNC